MRSHKQIKIFLTSALLFSCAGYNDVSRKNLARPTQSISNADSVSNNNIIGCTSGGAGVMCPDEMTQEDRYIESAESLVEDSEQYNKLYNYLIWRLHREDEFDPSLLVIITEDHYRWMVDCAPSISEREFCSSFIFDVLSEDLRQLKFVTDSLNNQYKILGLEEYDIILNSMISYIKKEDEEGLTKHEEVEFDGLEKKLAETVEKYAIPKEFRLYRNKEDIVTYED